jgi:hypothetical protein
MSYLQYQLAVTRPAELVRRAEDRRRAAAARAASTRSRMPVRHAPVELPPSWLRSASRQRAAHTGRVVARSN